MVWCVDGGTDGGEVSGWADLTAQWVLAHSSFPPSPLSLSLSLPIPLISMCISYNSSVVSLILCSAAICKGTYV